MQFIYGLYSTEDNLIRYVGKTNSLNGRLASHKYDALKRGSKNHKCNWIRSVYKNEYEIGIELIEECNDSNVDEREIYWIKTLKETNNLTNELEGGQSGGVGGKMKEYKTFDEMKEWMKINYPNIKSYKEYKTIPKEIKEKNHLPLAPQRVYSKRGEWKGMNELFQTGRKNRYKNNVTLNDIQTFIKEHNIKSTLEYIEIARGYTEMPSSLQIFCKRNNIEYNIEHFFKIKKFDFNKIKEICYKEKISSSNVYRQRFNELVEKYNDTKLVYHIERYGIKWENVLFDTEIKENIFKRYIRMYYKNIKTVEEWKELSRDGKINKRIPKRPDTKYKKPWSYFFPNIKPSKKK